MRNYSYQHLRINPRLGCLTLLIVLLIGGTITKNRVLAAQSSSDLLAYSVYEFDNKRSVMLYDPISSISSLVLTTTEFLDAEFSVNGNLAYSPLIYDRNEIHIVNALDPSKSPIIVRAHPNANEYPSSWSHDGHYLALVSYANGEDRFYIWDGEKTIDIMPEAYALLQTYSGAWSFDGRLAFTVRYDWYDRTSPDEADPSEIYLWDGSATIKVSQNPFGADIWPMWSADGRLAFSSSHTGESTDILVWDGKSFKNGLPDAATFVNVTPELTDWHSEPIWTNDGKLTFLAFGLQDKRSQIYRWDGKTSTISVRIQHYTTAARRGMWMDGGHFQRFFHQSN